MAPIFQLAVVLFKFKVKLHFATLISIKEESAGFRLKAANLETTFQPDRPDHRGKERKMVAIRVMLIHLGLRAGPG